MGSTSVSFDEAALTAGTPEELAGPPEPVQFAPVARQERINSLDVLRGFALMGILIMNITDFAYSYTSYLIPLGTWLPTFTGPHAKVNTAVWMLRWILAEGKMRALFSMLFGAGAVLLTDRAERRGGGDRVADIFMRRNMWLVLIGFLHAFLIWNGDILFWYGITGLLFLYPMRKLPPKTLLKAAGWLLLVWILIAGVGRTMGAYSTEKAGREAVAAAHQGKTLTEKQRGAIVSKVEQDKRWRPLRIDVEKSIADHHGYLKAQGTDAKSSLQSEQAIYFGFLDVLIFMMVGMALYKNGFLTNQLPASVYVKTAVIGYLIAIPITTVGVIQAWRGGFEIVSSTAWLMGPYDLCRISGALANASVVLLILRAGALQWLTRRIAAVGQTALSNYLLTSITCQFLFLWGPTHWYQYLEYYKLYYVVASVWTLNLIWSPIWLRYFQFGPVEWLWRSLTYWHRQPMRIATAA
ncbi:DUF418 domain-containing protein [Terriglobus roseus]|uniref:DUF418 domain-containing protein n=1 Tax=Terriglobus roseus TaxID=392734 RepID=A0A1H4U9C9_9BACT|nr:DUF418 domain-containing protein [Terriglobus roseus]SEC65058.1 uncharacterized protein SAMN05443244_3994 [Terriglobus roseus]